MSASVIASARTSTTSLFTVITRSAETVTGLLDAASLSADMLTQKTRVMHHGIQIQAQADMVHQKGQIIRESAMRTVEHQELIHKRLYPNVQFDAAAAFAAALKEIEEALQA